MASSLMSIPDHLKAEIFVRLPEPEDLARTAATCATFRRVLADGSFRRRFRLLHAPPLLGILDRDGFHPALPPHPSAPAARALAHAADFSFAFLPSHRRWAVQDVRDGRVLLSANPDPQLFTELVVCDPLHWRHILLPQVPHDLAASLEFPVHMVHRCQLLIASPGAGGNEAGAAMEEAAKGGESTMISSMHRKLVGCHYAYGCFYLESTMNKKLLVFDTRRMEFSNLDVPRETSNMFGLVIVEAGEGRLGMLDIHDDTLGGKCDLCYYIRGNKGESSSQWKIEKTISLPYDYQYYIQASTGRYLLLRKLGPLQSISSSLEVEYVSMDVKTLQLERVCGVSFGFSLASAHIYTNFPPSLTSSPTI
uniref:F-box domain-containing protein n=1 Tax=Aegilops tauschii TaxID=37682 RepID=N1QQZ7_AEGTA